MCGRFVSASPPEELARYFDAEPALEQPLGVNYNVAPTSDVYVVLSTGESRRLEPMHWGLVPAWAKDPKIGSRMINARAETLAEKPSFKAAFRRRRCIVPADGFFEWRKVPDAKHKEPTFITSPDRAPLAFAGLWEVWKDKERPGETLRSCTIITTCANDTMAPVHDRMPVILDPSSFDHWLDPTVDDLDDLGQLLVPARSPLTMWPVSTAVNNVRNKGAELIDPVDPVPLVEEA
jgi:putative SOS response-associated peptidase YedK